MDKCKLFNLSPEIAYFKLRRSSEVGHRREIENKAFGTLAFIGQGIVYSGWGVMLL